MVGDTGLSSEQLPGPDENEKPVSSDMNTPLDEDEDSDDDDTTDDNFNCDLTGTGTSPLLPQEEEEDHAKNNDNKNPLSNSHSHGLDDIDIDMDIDTDENWDLGSPLLPQPQRARPRRNDNNNHNGHTSARESEYMSGVSGGEDTSQMQIYPTALLDPFHFYMTISSSASLMLFIGLVVGSFYFPWSDTMMRISFRTILSSANGTSSTMDSLNEILETLTDGDADGDDKTGTLSEVVGGKLEFDLPLYSNATFRSTLGIFQSSHSNMLVGMILLTTVAAPAIWMMLQLVMVLKCHFIGLGVFRAKRSGYVSQSQHELYTSFEDEQEDIHLLHETMERYNTCLKFPLFLAKYSMAITYVNAILLVCTSNVRFALGGDYSPGTGSDDGESSSYSNTDEDNADGMFLFAQVVNDTRGGLISYLVGLTLGITAFMVLRKQLSHASSAICVEHMNMTSRSDSNRNTIRNDINANEDNINTNNMNMSGVDRISSHSHKSETLTIQSPPPIAFKMVPQRENRSSDLNSNGHEHGNIDETEFMFGSLDLSEPLITSRSKREREEAIDDGEFEHSPLYIDEAPNHPPQYEIPSAQNEVFTKQPKISRESSWTWFELFLFEGGLMSFLLLPPLLSEPLIQLRYTGILTPVLDESAYAFNATSLTFSTIIRTILTKSGSGLFSFVASGLLLVNIIVIPFISWICCSIAFIASTLSREEQPRHNTFVARVMRIPKALHPLSNITPFAISIIVTVMSLEQVSNFLFNQNRACELMAKLMAIDDDHEQCMIISGTLQPMVFVLLIQACAMDYYITLY